MKRVSLFVTVAALAGSAFCVTSAELQKGFENPPNSAKPHTWWHWMNGNVSKEGITADLEAMKAIGLGGAQILTPDAISRRVPSRTTRPSGSM